VAGRADRRPGEPAAVPAAKCRPADSFGELDPGGPIRVANSGNDWNPFGSWVVLDIFETGDGGGGRYYTHLGAK
jgi:hypothetical protein